MISDEWRVARKEFEERSRSSASLGSAEPSGMQNTQMTVGGVAGEGGQGPAPTAKKDAGLTPQRTRGVPTNRGKARRYANNSRGLRVGSGGFLEFEFGGEKGSD